MGRVVATCALLVLTACGGFTTPEATAEVGYTISSPLPLTVAGREHRLHLLQGKLVLRGLEARMEGGTFVPVSPSPLVVDVGRGGRVVLSEGLELARGDYVELRLGLYRLDPQVTADRELANREGLAELLNAQGACDVRGTADGNPFSLFCSEVKVGVVLLRKPWKVRSGADTALTLGIDPSKWLVEEDDVLDPASAIAGQELSEHVLESLGGFVDDDRNGKDD